jgi:hypothetical protein
VARDNETDGRGRCSTAGALASVDAEATANLEDRRVDDPTAHVTDGRADTSPTVMRSLWRSPTMNKRILVAVATAAALAIPAAAVAQPGNGKGKGADKPAKVDRKKPKMVTFVFRGTFTAPGTVEVLAGNAHVRKGGFVGEAVTVDLASAKLVVADTNGDGALDVSDVKDGDRVLVKARIAKGTKFAAPAEGELAQAIAARKLVDKTNPPVDDAESGD